MLIFVPLALPLVQSMSVDVIWFGIIPVIEVAIGLLTPPFGMSVFLIKSALDDPDVTLSDIFIGAAPFAVMMFVCLLAVIFVPSIAIGLLRGSSAF